MAGMFPSPNSPQRQPVMPPQQMPEGYGPAGMVEQAPMNSIRNNTTGAVTNMPSSGQRSRDVFADGPNVEESMELIRTQAIINALLTEAKIEVVLPPGIQVVTVGVGNLGAPVISLGTTTTLGIADGVIR
jgi:hypothetical protein